MKDNLLSLDCSKSDGLTLIIIDVLCLKDMDSLDFGTPAMCGKYFHKHAQALGLSADCSILDVAGGTGLAAVEVKINR